MKRHPLCRGCGRMRPACDCWLTIGNVTRLIATVLLFAGIGVMLAWRG